MVEREILSCTAILAGKAVAKEDVKPGERRRAVLSDDVIREFRTRHGELLDNYDALQEARGSRGV